jgi:hypothetical protein
VPRQRKPRPPGLAADGPVFVGRHELVGSIERPKRHFDLVPARARGTDVRPVRGAAPGGGLADALTRCRTGAAAPEAVSARAAAGHRARATAAGLLAAGPPTLSSPRPALGVPTPLHPGRASKSAPVLPMRRAGAVPVRQHLRVGVGVDGSWRRRVAKGKKRWSQTKLYGAGRPAGAVPPAPATAFGWASHSISLSPAQALPRCPLVHR